MVNLHDEMEGKKPEDALEQVEKQVLSQPEAPVDARSALVGLLGQRFAEVGGIISSGDKASVEGLAAGGAVMHAGAENVDLKPEAEKDPLISENTGIKKAPYEVMDETEGSGEIEGLGKVFEVMENQPAIGKYIETADTAAKYHETLGTPVEGNADLMILKTIALKGNELKNELGVKNLGNMMDAIPIERVLCPEWAAVVNAESMQKMGSGINPDEIRSHLAKFPENWQASVNRIEYNPSEQGDSRSKASRTFSPHKGEVEKPEDAKFVEFNDIIFQNIGQEWKIEDATYELSRRMAIINGFGGHTLPVPDRLDLAHIMMKRAQKPEIPEINWPKDITERQNLLRARMENGWGNMVANYMKGSSRMEQEEIDLVERFMGIIKKDAPSEKKEEKEPDAM